MKGFHRLFGRIFPSKRSLIRPALASAFLAYVASDQKVLNFADFKDQASLRVFFDSEVAALQAKHSKHAAYFPAIVVKQQNGVVSAEFQIDQRKCDIFALIVELFASLDSPNFRLKGQEPSTQSELYKIAGSDPTSPIKNQTGKFLETFRHGAVQTFMVKFDEKVGGIWKEGSLSISGEFSLERAAFKLLLKKESPFSGELASLFIEMYKLAYKPSAMSEVRKSYMESLRKPDDGDSKARFSLNNESSPKDVAKAVKNLKEMGLEVIFPEDKGGLGGKSWDELGGYEKQKRDIEDTILLGLTHSEVYDKITEATRVKFERSRPKAVLFEGPPGTGKTTSAKIIASTIGVPLIYLPAEAMLSKWYGDSEKSLASVFDNSAKLGKAIIFIDEIDSIAVSRDSEGMHEVSKRIVSTLLRKIDSFESNNEVLLICATNRKDKLDPAMLSRVDLSITFDLPDFYARKEIFKRYAKHLTEDQLESMARNSEGISGRGILETCKNVERRWASRLIRKEVEDYTPDIEEYRKALQERIVSHLL
jgi:ATP-dependent 26S proteasome regulatory subunit